MKGKGENETCIHLNGDIQRTARNDKKAFLNEQCKELEEKKNWMGKTRDIAMKIRDTKETFQAKMGTMKGKNDKDLIEAREIKKWQE